MLSKYNVRGIIGKDLKEKDVKKFAKQILGYINEKGLKNSIIIAKDNRESGDYLLSVVQAILLAGGVEVNDIGVATTPMLTYFTHKFKFGLGIMITASHNSKEYNGFKCFNSFGEMVDIDGCKIKNCRIKHYKKVNNISKFKELYWRDLKNRLNLNKIKCVFDCANGASVETIRKVFARHHIIGDDSSGSYINENYGTQHLDNIRAICKRNKKIGFAFDGDADRVIAIDEKGDIIDGDKILYILATQKLGFGDRIVGTQITSVALEVSLRRLGVGLIRERVGAKYVAKRIKAENLNLGGEPCGHVFWGGGVSDGVKIAIELLNILNRTGLKFEQLLSGYKQRYIQTKDISANNIDNFNDFESVDCGCRVVARKSGTENLIRILVDGENENIVKVKMEEIAQCLNKKDCL